MKLRWPWKKKELSPDVTVIIDYYHDTHSLLVFCYPTDMSDAHVVGILDMASDLIDAEGTVELLGHEDIENFILNKEPVKGSLNKSVKHLTRVK